MNPFVATTIIALSLKPFRELVRSAGNTRLRSYHFCLHSDAHNTGLLHGAKIAKGHLRNVLGGNLQACHGVAIGPWEETGRRRIITFGYANFRIWGKLGAKAGAIWDLRISHMVRDQCQKSVRTVGGFVSMFAKKKQKQKQKK
uniref:Uncharacterized protein n=1 Tax=Coccidioides posadasii RMSCC 3488 TaxID=454284 RepID=A0A0J6F465_COCPO|nr:hypothetical protein CPAG_00108 [Coccidioides posadasii RMSCC 3488]